MALHPMKAVPHPYASFAHLVEKPARYLGGEVGARHKDWSVPEARICLAFPDVYDIGMSHLGFKILYKILNDDPRTLAERAYTPWIDMEAELRKRGLPLVTCESARPLSDFDVVGFSLQFELTYTNILTMLELGGIPLRSASRGETDPLVIAGGPVATHPEPITPFIDVVVIGDGEEVAKELALAWMQAKREGVDRPGRLLRLSKLKGVYVPSLYKTYKDSDTGIYVVEKPVDSAAPFPIERAHIKDLNAFPFPDDSPIGGPEAIFDRMSIEIARGCTEGCRFCQAGMIYRPVRERDPDAIVEAIVSAVEKTGYDEASLTSLSTADYSCIAPLVKKVVDRLAPSRVSLGVSSLRAYGLEENVLDDMQRVRASGVTFAPEAGSQRMRDVINKNVTEAQLQETAERIFSRDWNSMKLYFMIGLPTEEEEDVREIPRVGGRAQETGYRVKRARGGGMPKVTVSVSTFVPKPHTPFQWCAMNTRAEILKKQQWLSLEARSMRVELRMHDSETSWLEGVFARGDRRLGDVLEHAYRNGARFDSWDDQKRLDVWNSAFEAFGIDTTQFLGTIPVTARLPWDHISVGLEDGFLAREYRKALKSRLSPPCGKIVGAFTHASNVEDAEKETSRKLVCYSCGVACDMTAMREERLVVLRRLGAETPRPKPEPKPYVKGPRRHSPLPPAVQEEVALFDTKEGAAQVEASRALVKRYRFGFEKIGPAAFLSHLDAIRALPRAFRRLKLPLVYSQGFHPKPDMVFGPALSLGISSLSEIVDIKIAADIDPSALLDALNESMHGGLRFTSGDLLLPTDAGASRLIDAAEYLVALPRACLDEWGGIPGLRSSVQTALAATELPVVRRIDGIGKRVNVREFVFDIQEGGEEALALLERAGFVGDLFALTVRVDIRGSGAVKISEVVEALAACRTSTGDAPSPSFMGLRTRLGRKDPASRIVPINDLVALRKMPPKSRSAEPLGAVSSPNAPPSGELSV